MNPGPLDIFYLTECGGLRLIPLFLLRARGNKPMLFKADLIVGFGLQCTYGGGSFKPESQFTLSKFIISCMKIYINRCNIQFIQSQFSSKKVTIKC